MSNLPPGCSINDIPGNRPQDIMAEECYAALLDFLCDARWADMPPDDIMYVLVDAGDAWDSTYNAISESRRERRGKDE